MVVIGPPGTGRSQTIANLMAHCLAHGKTVLFVAEKAAALDVVHRRLEAHGLADAVLELHSSKSDRQSVLRQLGAAWDRRADAGEAEWRRLSEELGLRREALDAYVKALHAPGSHGLSVFDAIGLAGGGEPGIRLEWPTIDAHDAASLVALRDLAAELGAAIRRAERPGALALVRTPEGGWSFAWQAELTEARRALREAALGLAAALERFGDRLGCEGVGDRRVLVGLAVAAAAAAAQVEGEGRTALGGLDPEVALQAGHDLSSLQGELSRCRGTLSAPCSDRDLVCVPVRRLEEDWRRADAAIWPFSALRRRSVRRELSGYAQGGRVDPRTDLRVVEELQERLSKIAASPLAETPRWAGVDTDAIDLRSRAARLLALREASARARVEVPAVDEALRSQAQAVVDAEAEIDRATNRFEAAASHRPDLPPRALVRALDELGAAEGQLQDWVRWCSLRAQAEGRGLGPLAEALEEGRIAGDAVRAFERAHARWWLPLAIDAAPVLRGFLHWEHDERVRAFRRIDEAHQAAAADQVRARLAHGLPDRGGVARNSALGQLKHQLGLQRPSKTIRALMADMGGTLTRLTPCVLMSPLSVAQYLPAGQAAFDIVIFDEASQITTWDAIGAVARARQSIVVGDPKQMPPTNFFGRTNDEEDDGLEHYERDLPSILDEAVAAGVPEHYLRVHYRSRDEALIAFSNERYYGNRLVTFPSPATDGRAVRLHRVDGVYRRGEGRTNPEEARAIVAHVTARLREWLRLLEDERPTLGVITFNIQQQQLILDLLDAARSEDQALEWFFEDAREEPLIVKNLENIQGDERDVMLFGVTFGRDAAGKLSMHFGAMNSDGGEKRLNVAVTRARRELHVFASIGAEDIDLARTKARGVRDLKAFLDYAARGPVTLAAEAEGSVGGVESPFEAQVKEALEARGWEVRPQIGVSGYRIDLGVVNPERAGAFLAGVECDGAAYHSSPTARDRDRVREAVLRSLGWRIERVWSTDWFMRRGEALDRLDAALGAHLEAWRAVGAAQAEAAASREEKHRGDAEPHGDADESPTDRRSEDGSFPALGFDDADGSLSTEDHDPLAVHAPHKPTMEHDIPNGARPAVPLVAALAGVGTLAGEREGGTEASGSSVSPSSSAAPDPERFFEPSYAPTLRAMVEAIVVETGPVHFDAVAREVARRHGWQRVGRRIREWIGDCAQGPHRTEEAGGLFLWPEPPEPIVVFRDLPNRDPSEICVAEVAGLLRERPAILRADDAAQELSRALGLSRLKSNRRAQLDGLLSNAARRLAAAS